jgi:hypothetical protein
VDKFFTVTATLSISTGVVVMSWDKVGVGIGKIRANGALDVLGDFYLDGKIRGNNYQLNVFNSVNEYRDCLHYYNASMNITGALVIDFGFSNYMIEGEINLYSYEMGAKILFKGYTFMADATWYRAFANITGNGTAHTLDVRFGKHTANGNRVMIIGAVGTVWNWLHLVMVRASMAFGAITNFAPTCTLITDESAYTMIAYSDYSKTYGMTSPNMIYTPVVTGTSTAGTGTYTYQEGRYTKIGKLVFVDVNIVLSNHTGTGNIRISLPFTAENTAGLSQTLNFQSNGLTLTTGHVASAEIAPNTAYVAIVSSLTGTTSLAGVPIDTACTLRLSGCYLATS